MRLSVLWAGNQISSDYRYGLSRPHGLRHRGCRRGDARPRSGYCPDHQSWKTGRVSRADLHDDGCRCSGCHSEYQSLKSGHEGHGFHRHGGGCHHHRCGQSPDCQMGPCCCHYRCSGCGGICVRLRKTGQVPQHPEQRRGEELFSSSIKPFVQDGRKRLPLACQENIGEKLAVVREKLEKSGNMSVMKNNKNRK